MSEVTKYFYKYQQAYKWQTINLEESLKSYKKTHRNQQNVCLTASKLNAYNNDVRHSRQSLLPCHQSPQQHSVCTISQQRLWWHP